MPLFDKRPDISRQQFKDILKKSNIRISGKQLSDRIKESIEKLDFPKKFGGSISHSEYTRTLNRLKAEKSKEHDFTRKIKIDKKIKFLEEIEKKEDSSK
jgi:hypothetical protein